MAQVQLCHGDWTTGCHGWVLWVLRRFYVDELLLTKEKFYRGGETILREDRYRSSGNGSCSWGSGCVPTAWIPFPGLGLSGGWHGCVRDKLSGLGLDEIELIFHNANGTFHVGPIPTLSGLFKSASQYFKIWATVMSSTTTTECNYDFPNRISCIAPHLSSYDRGPFSIFHLDFGYHNFLVDDQYNIVGIID